MSVRKIGSRIDEIQNVRVYYTLKQQKVRYVSGDQVFAIKVFIALREAGVEVVTSTMFHFFYNTTKSNAISMLHRLGDKGVLVMVKNEKPGPLRYILSEKFVTLWSAQPTSINT